MLLSKETESHTDSVQRAYTRSFPTFFDINSTSSTIFMKPNIRLNKRKDNTKHNLSLSYGSIYWKLAQK